MSVRVMGMVWENGPAAASERLMLLAIADHADDAGAAFPGVERLARKCCVTVRPAQNTLRALERDGWITVEIGGGRKNTNHYQINLARLQTPRGAVDDTGGGVTGNPAVHDANPAVSMQETPLPTAPEPSLEPPEEPSPSGEVHQFALGAPVLSHRETEDQQFARFWDAYPKRVDKGHARKMFVAALKKARFDDILSAVEKQKRTTWLNKERKYIPNPGTWLNGERWLDEPDQPRTSTTTYVRTESINYDGPSTYKAPKNRWA